MESNPLQLMLYINSLSGLLQKLRFTDWNPEYDIFNVQVNKSDEYLETAF